MTVLADVPTIGLYVGWFFGLVTLALAVATVYFLVRAARVTDHPPTVQAERRDGLRQKRLIRQHLYTAAACAASVLIIGGVTFVKMWPLRYEYHHYVSKQGVVDRIGNRIFTTGSGDTREVNQRYVITFRGDSQQYGIDDTRAASLAAGDRVGIKCKKEHQWFQDYGDDGFACRWGA